ncbi:MAG: class I SAM-dependent methyltransferase [Congregibacter sp.]
MKTDADIQSIEISQALESWYAKHYGSELCELIRERMRPLLDRAFGYHILQMGPLPALSLLDGSTINHRMYASGGGVPGVSLCCHGDELPLETASVDMLVAFHALEFDAHPHGSLREMQRVLRPQGHLVIIGFNPRSLFGFSHYLRRFRRGSLWQRHHPVSLHRLTDWLHLLDCELDSIQHLFPLPMPAQRGRGTRRRGLAERVDQFAAKHQLPGGSLYIAHAMKQIGGVRRPRLVPLRTRDRFVGLAVAGSPSPTPRHPSRESSSDLAS